MSKIKVKPISEAERKNVSSAVDEYIQNCRLRNLSPRTIEYYWEDLTYFIRCMNLQFADEITREVVDQLVLHEINKGNRAKVKYGGCLDIFIFRQNQNFLGGP